MNNGSLYSLAINRPFGLKAIGKPMPLDKAQAYQQDMIKGGFDVLVVNLSTLSEPVTTKRKGL